MTIQTYIINTKLTQPDCCNMKKMVMKGLTLAKDIDYFLNAYAARNIYINTIHNMCVMFNFIVVYFLFSTFGQLVLK